VKTWNEFSALRPDLAEPGRALLYQVGVGLGYLATTRPDGAPRLHPMCPVMHDAGLFAFIIPSPKQRDLRRDGRYALHSFPCEDNEDAFSFSGMARLVADAGLRSDSAPSSLRSGLGSPSLRHRTRTGCSSSCSNPASSPARRGTATRSLCTRCGATSDVTA
jgi:hypothetical protein